MMKKATVLFMLLWVSLTVFAQKKQQLKEMIPTHFEVVGVVFDTQSGFYKVAAKLYPQVKSYANMEVSYVINEKLSGLKTGSKGEGIIMIGEGTAGIMLEIEKVNGRNIKPGKRVVLEFKGKVPAFK